MFSWYDCAFCRWMEFELITLAHWYLSATFVWSHLAKIAPLKVFYRYRLVWSSGMLLLHICDVVICVKDFHHFTIKVFTCLNPSKAPWRNIWVTFIIETKCLMKISSLLSSQKYQKREIVNIPQKFASYAIRIMVCFKKFNEDHSSIVVSQTPWID